MSTQVQGLLKRLDEIVDGIDRDESDGGWWETEKGVELGKTTLRELRQLVTEAAQSTQPAPPADGEVAEFVEWLQEEADDYECIGCEDSAAKCNRAAELLQRQAPQPPADGEVAGLVADLQQQANHGFSEFISRNDLLRAAELLQRQAPVPVAVSDALIKAECALSDIAEGEPMTDEGDPLKWAERRCADTLAIIRPTMMQHKIRTSEWPPLPLPEVGE